MKIFSILVSIILLFITITIVTAADIIPKNDFIKITEQALDVLDKVEVVFSDSTSLKLDAQKSLKEFDIVMKKYNRYIKTWPDGNQGQIAWAMIEAELYYKMVLIEGVYGENHKKAEEAIERARSLFLKYKNSAK
ncbi:MAG: hypothetical protein WC637_00345 [Victivallales bacterium]